MIVGSHAYGTLLNELGINAPGYKTQDTDVARAQRITIALPDGFNFQTLLNETGLAFVPVPGMPSRKPLAVDLLIAGQPTGELVSVKELGAYAQAIPLLDFLIEENTSAIALSPNQVIPIRVPSPERFVIHKLFSSQSRRSQRDKIRKDLEQAGVLAAAIEDETPGRLTQTLRNVPPKARPAVKRGAAAAAKLAESVDPAASRFLARIASR